MNLETSLHSKPQNVPDIDWHSNALWAIGQIAAGSDGNEDYPISWRDHGRDVAWQGEQLQRMGAKKGSLLLQCGNTIDYSHNGAIQRACTQLSIPWAPVMAMAHDAYRLEMFLRRFNFDIVVGVNEGLLDGLAQMDMSLEQVFDGVSAIVATPGAQQRLAEKGVDAWTMFQLGPVIAYKNPDQAFAEFDQESWTLEESSGQIYVTSKADRACQLNKYAAGFSGSIDMSSGKPVVVIDMI